MNSNLTTAIFAAGFGQLSVLIASALVPVRLNWRETLAPLPLLVRQLFWVYGGYVVLSIIFLGITCLANAAELANGGLLARSVCAYAAAFWGIRLSLQPWLHAKPFLTTVWLRIGYYLLTMMFTALTTIFLCGALH